MEVQDHLSRLETTGLILPADIAQDVEYLFRHALVQEAAYTSLLRQDRKHLHKTVAGILEAEYQSGRHEHAPMLGMHYAEAGESALAARYYALAGEQSMRSYAIPVAISQFERALALVNTISDKSALPYLLQQHGLACEAHGDFDKACQDYEQLLELGRATGNRKLEWQALLSLGQLWAGRDYAKTGEYYQLAYNIAVTMSDASLLAHSLNHIGNWQLNVERNIEAINSHEQALAILRQLNDQRGIADTADFLGIASALSGRLYNANQHYAQAIDLYRTLGDQRGLLSSLTMTTLFSGSYQTNTLESVSNLVQTTKDAEEALELARKIGWRSAEAFALLTLAQSLGSKGEYIKALSYANESLSITLEIQHLQWLTFTHTTLGVLYLDLYALGEARTHLEKAHELAERINSTHWLRITCGFLASTCIQQGSLDRADTALKKVLLPGTAAMTIGQRLLWCAKAELQLAHGRPDSALDTLALLDPDSHGTAPTKPMLRINYLYGVALTSLGECNEAERQLNIALQTSIEQGALPYQFRILAALGQQKAACGDHTGAHSAFHQARQTLDRIAEKVPAALLEAFYRTSLSSIPDQ